MRRFLRRLIRRAPIRFQVALEHYVKCGYWPNLNEPSSFNEKVNFRKLAWENELFVVCSDKLAVRDFVAERLGADILIPMLYSDDRLEPDTLRQCLESHGEVVVKTNHNSGAVFFLGPDASDVDLCGVVASVNRQLLEDYGARSGEGWYDCICPRILVEKSLVPDDGRQPEDWKFHVFNDGGQKTIVLHIDFNRFEGHNRTFYTESLEPLPFGVKYPSFWKRVEAPKNYSRMLDIARTLATDFSYVRVDLYNIDGEMFFGEMTFAHESGFGRFSDRAYDFWMGSLWTGDPRY